MITRGAIVVAITAISTSAYSFTGNELLGWSRAGLSDPVSWDAGAHDGYIAGVSDAANGVLFCLPSGVTYRQSALIVKKYADQNPEKLHNVGANVVIWALQAEFPCKQ